MIRQELAGKAGSELPMSTDTKTAKRSRCPSCDNKGKRVSLVTLRTLLKDEFTTQIVTDDQSCCTSNGEGCPSIIGDTGWRFCDSSNCDVVYFTEDGDTTFTKPQLKVPVGMKETNGERPLCYCFGHSVASIKGELCRKGESDALDDIRARMKDPGCHCETANPSGSCCLGSVTKGIEIARKELEMNKASPAPARSSAGKGEKVARIGTVISAIMASACCWLPLLLLAVGVSGVGIAATLEAYRPVFIVVTFGFLAAAFYLTYRPGKSSAEAGKDCCAPKPAERETCCPPTDGHRFNLMTLNKVVLWAITVLAVAFLFFPSYAGALFGTGDQNVVTSEMNQAVFRIDGMTCEGCATTVAQAIRQVPGVLAVEVSYERRQAVVGASASQPIPTDRILDALRDAGYTGKVEADEAVEPESTSAPSTQATRFPNATGNLETCTVSVSGMTCATCAASVQTALTTLDGVVSSEVDLKTGKVQVRYDADTVNKKDIAKAVTAKGFKSRIEHPGR